MVEHQAVVDHKEHKEAKEVEVHQDLVVDKVLKGQWVQRVMQVPHKVLKVLKGLKVQQVQQVQRDLLHVRVMDIYLSIVVLLILQLALEERVSPYTYILAMHCGTDVMIYRLIATLVVLLQMVILVYLVGLVPLVLVK